MSISIQNNLAMMQANKDMKINTKKRANAAEKLSSGYRIGKAADDAAGLSISEKLRWQIRGLDRGSRNGLDGISWVQTGDAALNEVHDILHRMTELTVQSLNDTNTAADRAALQVEYDALQSEIDKIANDTTFNTKNVFDEHKEPYYQFTGNIQWEQSRFHAVNSPDNSLIIEYRKDANSQPQTVTVSVPEGVYTTQELIDELDDAFTAAGLSDILRLEYTDEGTCNLNLEGGEIVDNVSGGLSYLLYDTCNGGALGALIGTTYFPTENSQLQIVTGENDELNFTIESEDGTEKNIPIKLSDGYYTRSQLIDKLNDELTKENTTVRATAYAGSIKLASDDSIITGFSGNMFKIDPKGKVYHSVFYDNTKYGTVKKTSAVFEGAGIIPTDARDAEHQTIHIDSSNNTLTLSPNGLGEHTITLADGDYSINQIITKLNEAFNADNLMLTASLTTASGFDGIKIESSVKGLTSVINIDKTKSSAYETLFQNRTYNSYGSKVQPNNETLADSNAILTGGKIFSSGETLEIKSGQNDAFTLKLTSADGSTSSHTITLDAGTYGSSSLAQEINNRLNSSSAPAGYKDKLAASTSSGKITLESVIGSNITGIDVSAVSGNTGYNDIFVNTNISYTKKTLTASGNPPTLTLDTPLGSGDSLDGSNNKLTIQVDGTNNTIALPTGNDKTAITDTINAAYPGTTTTTPNTFAEVFGRGTTKSNTGTWNSTGKETLSQKSYSSVGITEGEQQGNVGSFTKNTPASITIDAIVPSNYIIDSSNNQLQLTVNDVTRGITIASGTYSDASSLAKALQSAVDKEFNTGLGGLKVTSSGGRLVLTANLPDGSSGAGTNISCSVNTSSFLKDLHTERTYAAITTSKLSDTINIDSTNNTFKFKLTENGVARDVSLTLSSGSYSRSQFINELNRQLAASNTAVTAALDTSGTCLTLKTNNAGNGYALELNSADCGTSSEAVFGPAETKTAPVISPNQKMQSSIIIDDAHNTFSVTVNGTLQTVTLDNGTYTQSSFLSMLNDKLTDAGIPVTASVSSGRLVLTGTEAGSDKSLRMTYGDGGTSMSAIYGETTTTSPKISASFDNDGKLVLKSDNGVGFSVVSGSDSYFCPSASSTSYTYPTSTPGRVSANKSYINGNKLTEPIKIDQWNNELKFNFTHDGTSTSYSITVPDGDYDFSSLQTMLQDKLDAVTGTSLAAGTSLLNVTVSAGGVRIEAAKPGNGYQFSSFSGDFYDKVIGSCTEISNTLNPSKDINGEQTVDAAYVVGRKDVKNKISEIKAGVNDELSLNFSYGNTDKKLKFTLDAGSYNGSSLVTEVQKKLNEALINAGLPENVILAKIGNVGSPGDQLVYGSNNDNALNFQLNTSIPLPDTGAASSEYIISGVGGSAAFTIFYQTDGDIVNAYVRGTKDISSGVSITPAENELSFKVDGTAYSITIPEGDYSDSELLDKINDRLKAVSAPLNAEIEHGNLKLVHQKFGTHKITDISGSAKNTLFFATEGSTDPEEPIKIQLSSNKGDTMDIDRPRMTTSFLGINSTAISRTKYANKSLVRLGKALELVSEARSRFGAIQNRLEHAISGNDNTSENTSAAESRLRDTDMAEYISEHSRYVILEQAAQAIQAQANGITEGVLKLLNT